MLARDACELQVKKNPMSESLSLESGRKTRTQNSRWPRTCPPTPAWPRRPPFGQRTCSRSLPRQSHRCQSSDKMVRDTKDPHPAKANEERTERTWRTIVPRPEPKDEAVVLLQLTDLDIGERGLADRVHLLPCVFRKKLGKPEKEGTEKVSSTRSRPTAEAERNELEDVDLGAGRASTLDDGGGELVDVAPAARRDRVGRRSALAHTKRSQTTGHGVGDDRDLGGHLERLCLGIGLSEGQRREGCSLGLRSAFGGKEWDCRTPRNWRRLVDSSLQSFWPSRGERNLSLGEHLCTLREVADARR